MMIKLMLFDEMYSSPAKIWDFGNLLIQRCNEISGWDNISYEVSSDIDT